jgi:hypothetical protein
MVEVKTERTDFQNHLGSFDHVLVTGGIDAIGVHVPEK